MVHEDLRLSQILIRKNFENAIKVNSAVGGSTNFVIHMLAIAGRMGVELSIDDFDELGSHMPLLVNLMPSGKYLMEDFYYAGGLPVVIQELKNELHMDAPTVNGATLGENTEGVPCYNRDVIATVAEPFKKDSGLAVLRGNLSVDGAIIKPSAAEPHLMQHRGRAVVFEDIYDYHERIDAPDLDVDKDCVLVLKQVGPKGFPGMPEVGQLHIPKKLLEEGVTDMVRISDGRMSGTSFGAVVLHVAPESAVGGVLAFVQNGDMIELDVPNRRLHLDISVEEIAKRRQQWQERQPHTERGYVSMYISHVQQANTGADFDFLVGKSGATVPHGNH
jgi:dihydroxy-acid dehydratase